MQYIYREITVIYPNRLLGVLCGWIARYLAPLRCILISVFWLFVYQTPFMRSLWVLVKSVFKIVTN